MLNQIGSIKSCSYDQFFLKSVRTKPYWMRRPKFRKVSLKGLSVQKRCWQNGTMRHSGKISRYVGNTRVYSVVNGKYLK
mgnify:FL=1